MAFLVRISAAWVPLGAYRLNRRSRYPLLDPLNGHKAVDLPNQRPVISTVLGHDRSHSKKLGSKRPSTDTQTMSVTGLSNYHDYICARIKFADPTPDKQRTNEDEAVSDAAKQAEQAQRYTIQAYLHRTRQPLELGV